MGRTDSPEFFESPLLEGTLESSTEDFVVATPSSSWTLLESIMDKIDTDDTDDDDGLAEEEQRLEAVSELLEELEREAITPEDVAFADDAVSKPREEEERPSEKRRTHWGAGLWLSVFLVGAALAFAATVDVRPGGRLLKVVLRLKEKPTAPVLRLPTPPPPANDDDVTTSPPPQQPPPNGHFDDMPFPFFGKALAAAKDRIEAALDDANLGQKAFCSAGLGVLGFAVGIPYVPGLTDNLLVAIAGVALPLVSTTKPDNNTNKSPSSEDS